MTRRNASKCSAVRESRRRGRVAEAEYATHRERSGSWNAETGS
jgi:hypothetical protein